MEHSRYTREAFVVVILLLLNSHQHSSPLSAFSGIQKEDIQTVESGEPQSGRGRQEVLVGTQSPRNQNLVE